MKSPRWLMWLVLTALATCVSAYVAGRMIREVQSEAEVAKTVAPAVRLAEMAAAEEQRKTVDLVQQLEGMLATDGRAARENEALLKFENAESMAAFAKLAKEAGLVIVGENGRLGVLRVRYGSVDDLARAIRAADGEAPTGIGANFMVSIPDELTARELQGNGSYVPFFDTAAAEIGVDVGIDGRGAGVKIAVLDGGTVDNGQFSGVSMELVDLVTGDPLLRDSTGAQHGTSVAGIIFSSDAAIQGLASDAQLLGIRVLDNEGSGDVFAIASGIIEAVDRGANIINLSLGGFGDSQVLRDAVDYASSNGVVLVAAVGNEGVTQVVKPAGYDNVIAVTAVDRARQSLPFSNVGNEVDIAAPGLDVMVATSSGDESTYVEFSGTSAAAPFVTGAIAVVASKDSTMTVAEAAQVVLATTDDAGLAGTDAEFGTGVVNAERALNNDVAGIVDLAVAGQYFSTADTNGSDGTISVTVSVQNRGTTTIKTATLNVSGGDGNEAYPITNLAPGATATQEIKVSSSAADDDGQIAITSSVDLGGDSQEKNDTLSSLIRISE